MTIEVNETTLMVRNENRVFVETQIDEKTDTIYVGIIGSTASGLFNAFQMKKFVYTDNELDLQVAALLLHKVEVEKSCLDTERLEFYLDVLDAVMEATEGKHKNFKVHVITDYENFMEAEATEIPDYELNVSDDDLWLKNTHFGVN